MLNGVPIMKGSTLNFNIIEGQFDPAFFDENTFEPMIEIVVRDAQDDSGSNDQVEHTR